MRLCLYLKINFIYGLYFSLSLFINLRYFYVNKICCNICNKYDFGLEIIDNLR